MKMFVGFRSVRLGWQMVSTMAVACTAASGANATIVAVAPYQTSFTLAGSVSPLYSLTSQQGSSSITQTVERCTEPGKYGGCDGRRVSYDKVTTTRWERSDFNSAQPDALIGMASFSNLMPSIDEVFTTASVNTYYYSLDSVSSGQAYTGIPFTPRPFIESPLANKYLHLKFEVDEIQYLGLAHFGGTGVDSIEYSAVEIASADTNAITDVPEPDSWMLLTAGLGLVGAGVLRRRNRLARDSAV